VAIRAGAPPRGPPARGRGGPIEHLYEGSYDEGVAGVSDALFPYLWAHSLEIPWHHRVGRLNKSHSHAGECILFVPFAPGSAIVSHSYPE
jgi:hypothetical protein